MTTPTEERVIAGHQPPSPWPVAPIPDDERELRGLEIAEQIFSPERRAMVAKFHDIPADDPALMPYLSWCAALKLSPTSGHVWLIPKTIKGRDGKSKKTVYKPAIGRDGLLQRARMTKGLPGGYKGMQFATVCERDEFTVEYTGDLFADPQIRHRFAPKPTEFPDGEAPGRWRGRIIGAWAKVFVDGEPPTFYYADLREHGQLTQAWDWNPSARERQRVWLDDDGKPTFKETGKPLQEWSGAWEYTSAMCLKSAQSYSLRIGLGVTGVIPVDEMSEHEPERDVVLNAPSESQEPDWGDDEVVAEQLKAALTEANRVRPGSFLPQKVRLHLAGADHRDRVKMLDEVRRFATANGGEISLPGDVADVGDEKTPGSAPQAAGAPASR